MSKRRRLENNDRMALAWHTAALFRAKKLPKLNALLAKEKKKAVRQSWQEQLAIARAFDVRVNANRRGALRAPSNRAR